MATHRVASNKEWEQWGDLDPLYGVSAIRGKEKGGASPWTEDDFYAMGMVHWRAFLAHWDLYGLDTACCVEIGCGAGRLTSHLAQCFNMVHALDVSPGMITYAQERIKASHVAFHLTNGVNIPLPDECASAVFSTHVFQHFDHLDHAAAYLAEAARVLRPGGTVMIHLPIHRWPTMPRVFQAIYRSRKRVGNVVAAFRRLLSQLALSRPPMRRLSYSVEDLLKILPPVGFEDIEVWIFCPGRDNIDPHPFVLARKVAGDASHAQPKSSRG